MLRTIPLRTWNRMAPRENSSAHVSTPQSMDLWWLSVCGVIFAYWNGQKRIEYSFVCLFVCRSVYLSRIIIVFTHPPFQFCSRFHFKHFCIPTKSFLPEIFSSMIPLSITNTIDYNTRLRTETTRNANENRSRFAIWWDREVERKNRVREHFCGSQIHKRSIPWVLAIFRICVRPFRCGRRKRTNQPSNKRCRICWMDNGKHARN